MCPHGYDTCAKFWSENLKQLDLLRDLSTNGSMILKWMKAKHVKGWY